MINGVAVEGIPVSEVNEILDRQIRVPWKLLILPSHLVSGYASVSGWCGQYFVKLGYLSVS
jgi:hypothetical protein